MSVIDVPIKAGKDIMKCPLIVAALVALPFAAFAQTDPMQTARLASANELGVMEYCQGKGWADQAAVDAIKASLATLPPATDSSGMAAAEATGKDGSLLNNGTAMPLSSMASRTNTSEQTLCGKFADSAKTVAAQQKAMPTMPAMPGGMPTVPGGMAMPSMPAMPSAPSMPAAPAQQAP